MFATVGETNGACDAQQLKSNRFELLLSFITFCIFTGSPTVVPTTTANCVKQHFCIDCLFSNSRCDFSCQSALCIYLVQSYKNLPKLSSTFDFMLNEIQTEPFLRAVIDPIDKFQLFFRANHCVHDCRFIINLTVSCT